MIGQTLTAAGCRRHPDVQTTIRCAICDRPFCRDCVVSRFVTTRSAVWLCEPCAGVRRAGAIGYGRHAASSVRGVPIIGATRRGWTSSRPPAIALAVAAAALLTAVTYLLKLLPL